jgi:hypothetical protein
METKDLKTDAVEIQVTPKEEVTTVLNELVNPALDKKKKRRHVSALVAASLGRSAMEHVDAHSYRDTNFSHTGSNPTFGEDE